MDPGLWVALIAVVVAWLVFRIDRWDAREGLIRALETELAMHRLWVGSPYRADSVGTWPQPDYMVFKLATVAVDEGIVRGGSLFTNPGLVISLVGYRQAASNLTQLIDKAMYFQANPELWVKDPPDALVEYMVKLTEAIHIQGIGDDELRVGAHAHYRQVLAELKRERESRLLPAVWFLSSLHPTFLGEWRTWPGRIKRKTWGRWRRHPKILTEAPDSDEVRGATSDFVGRG
jgi:hypothetical protein